MEELKFHKETVEYRGETYEIQVGTYTDPEDGYFYTTTESDSIWWKELRSKYITRHPEALSEFILTFPAEWIKEVKDSWEVSWTDQGLRYESSGKTKEEALYNLYLCLNV